MMEPMQVNRAPVWPLILTLVLWCLFFFFVVRSMRHEPDAPAKASAADYAQPRSAADLNKEIDDLLSDHIRAEDIRRVLHDIVNAKP